MENLSINLSDCRNADSIIIVMVNKVIEVQMGAMKGKIN